MLLLWFNLVSTFPIPGQLQPDFFRVAQPLSVKMANENNIQNKV